MKTIRVGALRRTMETFSNVTRFCLICNYVSRIIEPLASRLVLASDYSSLHGQLGIHRCAKMRFVPLDSKSMHNRLKAIASAEHVTYREEVYDQILKCCKGDMRRAVTLLQSCVNFRGDRESVLDTLEEISGGVPGRITSALWSAVRKNDFDMMISAVDSMM